MRRASVVSEDPPKVRAQFFYNSALPIDDPLSPVPLPSSNSTGPSRFPPRPFSVFDNTALEATWQKLQALEPGAKRLEITRSSNKDMSTVEKLTNFVRTAVQEKRTHKKSKSNLGAMGQNERSRSRKSLEEPATVTGTAAIAENPEEQHQHHAQKFGDPHLMLCDDPSHIPFDEAMPVSPNEIGNDEFESGMPKKRHRSPFRRKEKAEKVKTKEDASPRRRLSMHKKKPAAEPYGSSPLERDTTGTPFLRVPSRRGKSRSRSSDNEVDPTFSDEARSLSDVESKRGSRPASIRENSSEHSSIRGTESEDYPKAHRSYRGKRKEQPEASVAVGVSRLHLVKMPDLKVRVI